MSAALDDIRASVRAENCSESCSRDGCVVDLVTDVPTDRVIVDADKAFPAHGQEGRRCDFILFVDRGAGPLLAAPVELKSGRPRVPTAIEQLQGGADFAARFAPTSPDVDCWPILFHGNSLQRGERHELNNTKIDFRGRKRSIMTARCKCAGNLASVLPA